MKFNVFWFRRDLRLEDNTGLYHALRSGNPLLPIFIFDMDILNKLENPSDPRVEYIHSALNKLNDSLAGPGSGLLTFHGKPVDIWKKLIKDYDIDEVFVNNDYEPHAIQRDNEIRALLGSKSIKFNSYKDQVIFEKDDVLKPDGRPYTKFTPYSAAWKRKMEQTGIRTFNAQKYFEVFLKRSDGVIKFPKKILSLNRIGFKKSGFSFPSDIIPKNIIRNYHKKRDFPAEDGTSRLSVHLRFGTISIRKVVKLALILNEKWLNELIWREFYMMIIYHFPHSVNSSFHPEYDFIKWRNNEKEFDAWCNGITGYPIVDAGMRELNMTGYMHNRVRMITASFLCKHLLIDWRWGEAYFAEKLLDYDLAANNGNWQWVAGTGCDASPYFRVFNPDLQQKKFDPCYKYIKKWIPGFDSSNYIKPIVEHRFARDRAIKAYKAEISGRKNNKHS